MERPTKIKQTWCNALIYGSCQIWHCQRFLNNRGTLAVYNLNGRLWRNDRQQQTTIAKLAEDSWKREKDEVKRSKESYERTKIHD